MVGRRSMELWKNGNMEAGCNGVGRGARCEKVGDEVESCDVLGFLGSSYPGCGFGCDVYSVVC